MDNSALFIKVKSSMCSSEYDLNTRRTSHLIVMLDPQAKLGQKNVSLCHSIQKTIYENLLEKQFGQSGGYLVFVLTCRDIVTVDRLRSVMIMGIRTAWLASYQHSANSRSRAATANAAS